MASNIVSSRLLAIFLLSLLGFRVEAQLSIGFYSGTCPRLQSIVSTAMASAVANESRMGASILRLFFHDCFVNVQTNI